MFKVVQNLFGGAVEVAPPKDVFSAEVADDVEMGQVCKFDADGKLAAVDDNDDEAAVIALEAGKAADDDKVRFSYILPGMVYKAEIEGDMEDLEVGMIGVQMADDGKKVNANETSGGCLTILRLGTDDNDNEFAWVCFNKCALAQ